MPEFEYQQNNRYFAQTQRGLEPAAKLELEELGGERCSESFCGVYFTAPKAVMYRVNYCARTISRVLAPLATFECLSEEALYRRALEIPWTDLMPLEKTFAVFGNVSESRIVNSKFAGLKLKDAVADTFRKKYGRRPDVNPERPDIWISVNIHRDEAVISVDTSGGSLHRRRYRQEMVDAPMNETLAAGVLRLAGWPDHPDTPTPLLDPMCGSGTLLAEALMTYCRIPASNKRKWFGFFHLPDFDFQLWNNVRAENDSHIRECPPSLIRGSDVSRNAVEAALQNLAQIPGGARVGVSRIDFHDIPAAENMMIVTNPPYGVRLSKLEQTQILYKEFGDFLKQRCKGSTAWIVAGSKELTKHIGLKISRRIPLYNSNLEVRLIKVELY